MGNRNNTGSRIHDGAHIARANSIIIDEGEERKNTTAYLRRAKRAIALIGVRSLPFLFSFDKTTSRVNDFERERLHDIDSSGVCVCVYRTTIR